MKTLYIQPHKPETWGAPQLCLTSLLHTKSQNADNYISFTCSTPIPSSLSPWLPSQFRYSLSLENADSTDSLGLQSPISFFETILHINQTLIFVVTYLSQIVLLFISNEVQQKLINEPLSHYHYYCYYCCALLIL